METNWSDGEQGKKVAATSRRPNVTTSPRRDVLTSRRWVNQYRSQQVKTSRRLNVATSQRRDASSRSAPHHLKYEWLRNQGIGRRTKEGTEFQSRAE